MAATTPNLGLTLPVGNEKVSRQIINGNNSIIDTAFGSAGAKLLDIELNEVTNVSGAYTGTTYDDRVTSAMKALEIEMGNPGAFRANITVNCGAGYITLSCSDVVGTSTVKVSVLKLVQDPTQVTSTEFDILNNRIGTLDNLDTTNKTSTVAAINEVKGDIPPVINNLTSDSTTSALSAAQGKALNNKITNTVTVTDCNDAIEQNVVYMCKGSTPNAPDTSWHYIRPLYINGSNLIVQIATSMNTQSGDIHVREKANSGWGPWHTYVKKSQIQNPDSDLSLPWFRHNILDANATWTLTEKSVQRSVFIYTAEGGIYVYDRWSNIRTVHADSGVTITKTGDVNVLGTLVIKNNTNSYKQVTVLARQGVF